MTRRALIVALVVFEANIPLALLFFLLGVNVAGYATLLLGTACVGGIACGVIVV